MKHIYNLMIYVAREHQIKYIKNNIKWCYTCAVVQVSIALMEMCVFVLYYVWNILIIYSKWWAEAIEIKFLFFEQTFP